MNNIKQNGFTLIEVAIVLVVIGLLVGSFIGSLTQRIENTRVVETEDELKEIKTAILGYTYKNGYMPCADCFLLLPGNCTGGTARDGSEDRDGNQCSNNSVGMLPWATLGLGESDAWGTRYRYWVDPAYAHSGTLFDLDTDDAGGEIQHRLPDDTDDTLAEKVVAVIVSHGKNGYGGITTDSIALTAIPAANVDEAENTDLDPTDPNDPAPADAMVFMSRPPSGENTTTIGGEFDDQLIWISEFELKAKMVEAGRLP